MAEVLRFRGFELDPSAYELRRGSRPVKLERLAMDLLIMLASRGDSLLSREEIIEKLWGRGIYFDSENGINTVIRKVRKALSDHPERPRFVLTVPGKGYRFIAPVFRKTRSSPGSKRIVIAVLPFVNLGHDASEDYFCDGMTEETIANLGAVSPENLGVIARTSSMAYRNTTKSITQIGVELGVDYILESSARRENNRIRITSQLIRTKDQTHVWAGSYDRDNSSALAIQSELGRAITAQVLANLPTQRVLRIQTTDPDAYDYYLRGRFYFAERNLSGIKRAIEFYKRALEIDPNYSLASAGLADAYATLPITSDYRSSDCREPSDHAAKQAILQNPDSAEAHSAMAACCFWLTWDWEQAIESATHSIEINPNYALAHFYLAHTFSNMLQHDRAARSMARARALDPFSVHLCAINGQMLYQAGRFDAAIAEARKALAINPRSWLGHHILGKAKLQTGDLEEALVSFQYAFEFSGGNTEPLSLKAFTLSRMGRGKESREIVALMEEIAATAYVPPYNLAMAYHGLGDRQQTLRYLELAAQQCDVRLIFFPVDPKWSDLNQDPQNRKFWPKPQRNLFL